jgi:hypothetical protein
MRICSTCFEKAQVAEKYIQHLRARFWGDQSGNPVVKIACRIYQQNGNFRDYMFTEVPKGSTYVQISRHIRMNTKYPGCHHTVITSDCREFLLTAVEMVR